MKAGRMRAVLVLGAVLVGGWLTGCDWGGGDGGPEHFPPATKILEVRVEPNPVVVGDTTTFTCVVSDSMDADLEFTWLFGGKDGFANTDANTYQWVAYDEPGIYTHRVDVSRPPGAGFEFVSESFQVEVIAPE